MTSDDKAFHNMLHSTVRTRSEHAAVSAAPPALVRAFDTLSAIEARINNWRRSQDGIGLEAITAEKETLQRAAAEAIHPIAGALQALAAETTDPILLALADVSITDLIVLDDPVFANRCTDILAAITPARRPTLITDYGLTEDGIEDAQDLLEEFTQRIGAPRQAIGQRKIAGEEITRAITEARQLLKNRLDPLMRQFNQTGTTPESIAKHLFHEAYQTARIIVDAPSKKKKPAEDGSGGNASPTS